MDFLNKYNLKFSTVLKAAGIILVFIILVFLAFKLVGSTFSTVFNKNRVSSSQSPSLGMEYYDSGLAEKGLSAGGVASDLSVRNMMPVPPAPGGTTGADAEAYEVTDYSSSIEAGDLKKTCAAVSDLKALTYVIFENASQTEKYCNYSFKVAKEHRDEILSAIKKLDPKELTESTYTIKNLVEDYTNELEILTNKRDAIESTLESAIGSYDEITAVATAARDATALATIIDSKVRIIERLTQEKININTQLDRLARSKAERLDRLDYVYFHLAVYENKYIDGDNLKDSWRQAIREFVHDVNDTIQDVSINLLALVLRALQVIFYLLIILVVAKYGWRFVKSFWRK